MNNPIKKPIIILGAPRSGTSILGRILSQHKSLYYANEPRLIWRYMNDSRSDCLRVEHASEKCVDYIQRKFAKLVASEQKGRLLEKTPSSALRIDFINKVFPDCKFIHIIRNGYDSTLSIRNFWDSHVGGIAQGKIDQKDSILMQRLKEMHPTQLPYYVGELASRLIPSKLRRSRVPWGPRLPGMNQMVRDLGVLEVSALQWKMCVEHAALHGRQYGSDRYFECKLEDFDSNKMQDILKFCELSEDTGVEKYINEHFVKGMSSKRKFSADEVCIANIRSLIEPTMDWLGYE